MAKRKRKKPQQPSQQQVQQQKPAERTVPKFEIGVKGDEFDIAYTRAAAAEKQKVDALLTDLFRESRKSSLNLLNFAILSLLILMMALSFAFLSRSALAPALRADKLANGSYLSELSEYYDSTLPFGRALRTLGAKLGFCDMPEPLNDSSPELDEPLEPAVTTAATEPAVTTVPTTTATPTSAPITEETEATEPETHTMYANGTINIRLEPSVNGMIMGYFSPNEQIEVIELRSDGWASIWYNGMIAYVHSDKLGQETIRTTRKTTVATTTTTEETTEEITTTPEETTEEITTPEVTTEPEPETEVTTSTEQPHTPDFDVSAYWEYLQQQQQQGGMNSTAPEPQPEPQPQPQPEPAPGGGE